MTPNRVNISPEALFQEIGGEAVILDLASSSYFGLDEVGTRYWQLLQESPEYQTAFNIILAEYEVTSEQLAMDLEKLTGQLVNAGLASIG